ncbi:MAG: YkgJ family cysteine cluster protein [Desulfobacteraceae bacterium]|nr:YkgJ family cysteine cluster protein [Desulfobacteraceae bacterium]
MRKPARLRFEEHERKYKWLTILLRAYFKNDLGTYDEMFKSFKKNKRKIACSQGCYICCLNPVVPITQLELMGISWYVSEIVTDSAIRDNLKVQMENQKDSLSCPFLINQECSIYPLRPIACREYYIIGKACIAGENLIESRPEDIWKPSRKVARKTAIELLRFYGFETEKERLDAYEDGHIHRNTKDMHNINWTEMVRTMNLFDRA